MKGVIFNLLQEVVSAAHGADAWDDILDEAGVSGAYTSLGSYDDEEWETLVETASARLSLSRNELLRWFGQDAMPHLARAYPVFFEGHVSSRSFLAGVNDIIHAEVHKLYAGAACPHLKLRTIDAGGVSMAYTSQRRMCALAQGFTEGAARQFNEVITFEHAACVEKGDSVCVFHIGWPPLEAAAND